MDDVSKQEGIVGEGWSEEEQGCNLLKHYCREKLKSAQSE